jgi:hypothetical protein
MNTRKQASTRVQASRAKQGTNAGKKPAAARRPGTPARTGNDLQRHQTMATGAARRRRHAIHTALAAGAILVGTFVAVLASSRQVKLLSGAGGPENIPLEVGRPLAPASTASTGATVDGIQCTASEQVAYHVHTHLTVYVDGTLRPLPAGIGIVSPVAQQTADGPFYEATECYYWLHVHAQDGVIHVESPTLRTYSLGQFFDIWRQPLSRHQVGTAEGKLKVFVNGRLYQGNPRNVSLGPHEDIQIDVGSPVVSPKSVDWSGTGL